MVNSVLAQPEQADSPVPGAQGPVPVPPTIDPGVKRRAAARRRRRLRATLTGWAFAGPAALVIGGLTLFPAVWAFFISMTHWNGFGPQRDAGFANYQEMASDPDLAESARHTLTLIALFVPSSVLLGALIAVALNREIRFISFYRTAIFVPYVASAAATGVLFTFVFNPQFGVANNGLRAVGLPRQGFLDDPKQALSVIAVIALWGSIGFVSVIYLAALQGVSPELLDAAAVDGAGRWRTFWHITLPELRPITVFAVVWQTIDALQLFDLIYVAAPPNGNLGATRTVMYYVFELFRGTSPSSNPTPFSYGAAVAYGLFAVTILLTLAMFWYSKRSKIEAF